MKNWSKSLIMVIICLTLLISGSVLAIDNIQEDSADDSLTEEEVESANIFKLYVDGVKENYTTSELIKLQIKGLELDGTPSTPEEGFSVQVYIFKHQEKNNYQAGTAKTVFSGNTSYSDGYWNIDPIGPFETGIYRLQASLYCSRDNSYCADTYGRARQVTKTYWFEVKNGTGEELESKKSWKQVFTFKHSGSVAEPNKPGIIESGSVNKLHKYALENKKFKVRAMVEQFPNNYDSSFPYKKDRLYNFTCYEYDHHYYTSGSWNGWVECQDKNEFGEGHYIKFWLPINSEDQPQMSVIASSDRGSVFVKYAEVYVESELPKKEIYDEVSSTKKAKPIEQKPEYSNWKKVLQMSYNGLIEDHQYKGTVEFDDNATLRQAVLDNKKIKIKAKFNKFARGFDSYYPYKLHELYEISCDKYTADKQGLLEHKNTYLKCDDSYFKNVLAKLSHENWVNNQDIYREAENERDQIPNAFFRILISENEDQIKISARTIAGSGIHHLEYIEVYVENNDATDSSQTMSSGKIKVYNPKDNTKAKNLYKRLEGKIVLKAEGNGEAFYVSPKTKKVLYLKDGSAAYEIMREEGLGVNEADFIELMSGTKNGKNLRNRLTGRIVLRVHALGEAYYVNPNGTVTYMPNGSKAYEIMRNQSLGVSDADLSTLADIE